jgi:hypothetical protein
LLPKDFGRQVRTAKHEAQVGAVEHANGTFIIMTKAEEQSDEDHGRDIGGI